MSSPLSIARTIQLKNRKNYAKGGVVPDVSASEESAGLSPATDEPGHLEPKAPITLKLASGGIVKAIMAKKMAKDGEVEDEEDLFADEAEPSFEDEFPEEPEPKEDKIKSRLASILSR